MSPSSTTNAATDVARRMAFWFGIVLTLAVLSPPFDEWTETSLTVHMFQHVTLLTFAPFFLVIGGRDPFERRWSLVWLRQIGRQDGTTGAPSWALGAAVGVVVQTGVMLVWHIPIFYDTANAHELLHLFEHVNLVFGGLVFWWAVGVGVERRHPASSLVIFVAALPGTALGAAMTLAAHPWYSTYPDIGTQQLAGMVMWAFAGAAYLLAAVVLFFWWLNDADRRDRATPSRPSAVPLAPRARSTVARPEPVTE